MFKMEGCLELRRVVFDRLDNPQSKTAFPGKHTWNTTSACCRNKNSQSLFSPIARGNRVCSLLRRHKEQASYYKKAVKIKLPSEDSMCVVAFSNLTFMTVVLNGRKMHFYQQWCDRPNFSGFPSSCLSSLT